MAKIVPATERPQICRLPPGHADIGATPPAMDDNMTAITADKQAAYRATHYHVLTGAADIVLAIDTHSPALGALLADHGVTSGALITAHNPFGTLATFAENAAAQSALEAALRARGVTMFPTRARDPGGDWPDEAGVFAVGLAADAASDLGRAFRQDAVLWCGADAIPRLLLLR